MNRNTELRKKVHNVARPDDADPTSEKSKLAKQAEIKTKIIDEVALDAGPNQPMSLEDYKVGDMVHAGIGTKGGAGYRGKVHHVDAFHVYLNLSAGKYGPRIVKAPKHLVTKENEDFDADFAAKGNEIQTMLDKDKANFDAKNSAPAPSPTPASTPAPSPTPASTPAPSSSSSSG